MKTIHRYIIKDFFPPLFLGWAVFTFIVLMDKIFDLLGIFISKGIAFTTIVRLFGYIFPTFFPLTIPMAFLIATLLTFGRFSEDNEITACRSSGIKIIFLIQPILFISLLGSLGLIHFNKFIAPRLQNKFKDLYREILVKSPTLKLDNHSFTKIQNYWIYIEKIDHKKSKLKGIIIYRREDKGTLNQISAKQGTISATKENLTFNLEKGSIEYFNPESLSHYNQIFFNNYTITLNLSASLEQQKKNFKAPREMTTEELLAEIQKMKEEKIPPTIFITEYQLRPALAMACFVFALIGTGLGIKIKRGGKSIGFGLSLIVIFLYYLFLIVGTTLAEKSILPPVIAVQLPNLIFGFIGTFLIFQFNKK